MNHIICMSLSQVGVIIKCMTYIVLHTLTWLKWFVLPSLRGIEFDRHFPSIWGLEIFNVRFSWIIWNYEKCIFDDLAFSENVINTLFWKAKELEIYIVAEKLGQVTSVRKAIRHVIVLNHLTSHPNFFSAISNHAQNKVQRRKEMVREITRCVMETRLEMNQSFLNTKGREKASKPHEEFF